MALSDNAKRLLRYGLATAVDADAISTAIDANTLKTGVTEAASVTTTTSNATTTFLHTAHKATIASLKASGAMS